jgi:hypothetical protein
MASVADSSLASRGAFDLAQTTGGRSRTPATHCYGLALDAGITLGFEEIEPENLGTQP